MAKNDYEVGYRKPPRVTRFTKGKSGNPKGRPKKSRSLVVLVNEELDGTVLIQENGRQIQLTKREALVKRIVNNALNGDAKSTQALISMDHALKEQEPEVIELTATDAEQFERLQQRILGRATGQARKPRASKPRARKGGSGEGGHE